MPLLLDQHYTWAMNSDAFTHLDERGAAHMVDVTTKPKTQRRAVAEGWLKVAPETAAKLKGGEIEKGDALAVARIAGIQGAKQTSNWIPLCHPLSIRHVVIDLDVQQEQVRITAEVQAIDRTGVEMEAMVAVCAAGMALYDMVKGVDRSAELSSVRLLVKEGGRSGTWKREGSSS